MAAFNTDKRTAWVIAVVTAGLVAWDYYALGTGQPGGTISEVMLTGAIHHPAIPFLAGVLCGHLFVPQVVEKAEEPK